MNADELRALSREMSRPDEKLVTWKGNEYLVRQPSMFVKLQYNKRLGIDIEMKLSDAESPKGPGRIPAGKKVPKSKQEVTAKPKMDVSLEKMLKGQVYLTIQCTYVPGSDDRVWKDDHEDELLGLSGDLVETLYAEIQDLMTGAEEESKNSQATREHSPSAESPKSGSTALPQKSVDEPAIATGS